MDEFDIWFHHMEKVTNCQRLKAQRLAHQRGGVVLARTRWDGSPMGAMITPAQDGRWRITWFDERGFSGDTARDTKEACVMLCLEEGYTDSDRNLLRKLQRLDSFHEGNEMTTEIARQNAALRLTNAQAAVLVRATLTA